MTMPSESPTRMRSQCLSSRRAVWAWYEVRQTIGSPPLRARMSGAVSRLISSCADIGETLECRPAEHRDAYHKRMADKTQREIEHGSDDERDDVVAASAGRNRRCARIGSALERHPVVAGPGEK